MYVPDHFKITEKEEIFSFLAANAFGQLISIHDSRLTCSHLPFLVSSERDHLYCHLARQNTQWQQLEDQQVLLTFQGASSNQIVVISYGEERPAVLGHDESAWQLNRRAELVYGE